jgi:hypothetical protein
MDEREQYTPRPTAAELEPIRVHHTKDGWQADYGSYAQGFYRSFDEAIETAMAAADREGRGLAVEPLEDVATSREQVADARDQIADERERIADERDRIAGQPDAAAQAT